MMLSNDTHTIVRMVAHAPEVYLKALVVLSLGVVGHDHVIGMSLSLTSLDDLDPS